MTTENKIIQTQEEMWAIVELMGHGQTAGRVEKPTEWGGLMRVDVPDDDGYRTEFYSKPYRPYLAAWDVLHHAIAISRPIGWQLPLL